MPGLGADIDGLVMRAMVVGLAVAQMWTWLRA